VTASAIEVTESDDVLVARMASGGASRSTPLALYQANAIKSRVSIHGYSFADSKKMRENATMAIGEALKAARAKAGLTQGELARESGLTLSAVTKLEQGVAEPTWRSVKALARALGVSLDSLAAADDDTLPHKAPKKKRR
jgi:ribosome-binding protein aMBF1 (putative translation factor)